MMAKARRKNILCPQVGRALLSFTKKKVAKKPGNVLYNDLLLNCYSLTSIVIFKTNRTVLKNRELSKIIND